MCRKHVMGDTAGKLRATALEIMIIPLSIVICGDVYCFREDLAPQAVLIKRGRRRRAGRREGWLLPVRGSLCEQAGGSPKSVLGH